MDTCTAQCQQIRSTAMPPDCLHSGAAKGTILVVEDEADLAEILEFNLVRNGYLVHVAGDGLSACRLIPDLRPDLILLDILLPDLNGWEICRQVRQHPDPAIAATPIIMLSALGALDHRLKGLEMGADAYLAKPYALQEVLLCARALLARARQSAVLAGEVDALRTGAQLQADIQGMLFHELRNQMVVFGGYSRLLAQHQEPISSEKSRRYMEAVGRCAEHLTRLAEELLLTRPLPSGELALAFSAFDPSRPACDMAALLAPLAEQRQTTIEVQAELAIVWANEPALRLLLSILLENAVKFGGSGNVVHVRSAPQGDRVRLEVEDQGPGIAEEDLPFVFEKFYRGKADAQRVSGSGLGLHIARLLARAMQGELTVASRRGEGARFMLWLPAADSAAKAAPPAKGRAQ